MRTSHILLLVSLVLMLFLIGTVSAEVGWTNAGGCWTYTQGNNVWTMWNATGADSYKIPSGVHNVSVLAVAAGGSGGSNGGAGGGAGGVFYNITFDVISGQSYNVTVGTGGTGVTSAKGNNGGFSVFGNTTVTGGGGGGTYNGISGNAGGSGGGAGSADHQPIAGGAGISDQGFAGGRTLHTSTGTAAGGGGSGATGGDTVSNTEGGVGGVGTGAFSAFLQSIQIGVNDGGTYRIAAGGGGSASATPGAGGVGGGGAGATSGAATAGTANTGSGGGGQNSGAASSGAGGSGIVVVYYELPTPVASFTKNQTECINYCAVAFVDTSTGSPTVWEYSSTNVFGNNTATIFSTLQNPTTIFTQGNHTIKLNVTNARGSNVSIQTAWINISSSVFEANFVANVTTGYPNDWFQFTDTSLGIPTTWNWTFGDGGNSTDRNPLHRYVAVGSYDVSLNVTNLTTFETITKPGYITIFTLPAPTAPSFTANITYTTNATLPVLFTVTSAPPLRMTSYNMSFGDSAWNNVSSDVFSTMEHTYPSAGVYSPTLYIYNAAGSANTTSSSMIVVSDPLAYLASNPTTINYGVPGNLTLQLDNVSHVDTVFANVTYNTTSLQVKGVYAGTGVSGAIVKSTIGNGFVSFNVSKPDQSFGTNTSFALIQFNVTKGLDLNSTEPINFVPTVGIIPNASYTQELYPFNKTYNGAIQPVNSTLTNTFNIYRTDTGELLSTVQVTNDYTGVTSGTIYTTTGSFTVSSTWGFINITSSASAFYTNNLYGVEINGGTSNIYMTPYVPDNTVKLNQLYPKEVRFVALNTMTGAVMPLLDVSVVSYNATYDGTNWEAKLYGVSSAATSIQGTTMAGITDAGGSVTFPMISSNQYAMSFINLSQGVNQSLLLYPLQTEYRVWVDITGATNNTLNQISGSNLTVNEPNSSYVTLGMNYIDTSGLTENVTFSVVSQSNSTVMYTETITSGIVAGVSSDYTLQNIRGDGFVWKYVAYRSDSSVLSQGAGVTMKGPNGVLVDLGLPSTGWYQWISMCCLFMLASLASQRTKQYWALLIPIFAAIFLWFGWFTGKSTLAGIVVLCAVLGAIIYMKSSLREKFGIGGPGTMLLNIVVYLMILQVCVGFINGLEIWSGAGIQNQAVTPLNAYTNIEIATISHLQGAAGLTGSIIATATIFVDMALTALGIFGFMLFSLVTIYPTIQLLFPWMLQSPQTIALFTMLQLGIWVMYVLFIYQTWYKPTIGTADF